MRRRKIESRNGNAWGFLRKTLSEVKRVAAVCGVWDWNCGIGSEIGSGYEEYEVLLGFAIFSNQFQDLIFLLFYLFFHDSFGYLHCLSVRRWLWVCLWDGGVMASNFPFQGLNGKDKM